MRCVIDSWVLMCQYFKECVHLCFFFSCVNSIHLTCHLLVYVEPSSLIEPIWEDEFVYRIVIVGMNLEWKLSSFCYILLSMSTTWILILHKYKACANEAKCILSNTFILLYYRSVWKHFPLMDLVTMETQTFCIIIALYENILHRRIWLPWKLQMSPTWPMMKHL